ncbi:MAG: AmmeMemoRadiSam system protein B, partial [Gammaproteobacteria bacterium]
MNTSRPAAVAGMFYPADPQELHDLMAQYLQHAAKTEDNHDTPKAIIAPHAGYVYSGPIAASAYARLLPA